MDRRGHGRSDAPDPATAEYTAARHADDLAGLLDAVGVTHAVVVAHAGGMIDAILGDDGAAAFAGIYATFFGPHAGPVAAAAVTDAARVPRPVAAAELRSLAIDTVDLARSVKVPVLWLTVAAADEVRLHGVFADAELGRVVGSGHFPHLEVPDQVNAMIDRFVATRL